MAAISTIPGLPFLGNTLDLRRDPLALWSRLAPEFGDICRYRVMRIPVIAVTSAPLAYSVLVENERSFGKERILRVFGGPLLGRGLITSDGEFHRRQRRLLAPAFAPKRLAMYAHDMVATAERIITGWRAGMELEATLAFPQLTLGIVARTLFHAEVAADAETIGRAFNVANRYIGQVMGSLLRVPPSWSIFRRNRVNARAIAELDGVVGRFIRDRRASGRDEGDVLSLLLTTRDDNGVGMTDVQVRDELMNLFFAGHETTASTLAFATWLLARHPDVRARLEAEVAEVIGPRNPSYEDLARLPYTLAVLKETMRLYPPVSGIGRRATRDVDLGGVRIQAGEYLTVNVWGIHRRPDYFPAPERFQPERFLGEAARSHERGSYLPFGAGPRVCIGNHFALMEGQLVLAMLAQRVRLELVADQHIVPKPWMTLQPSPGVRVIVRHRDARRSDAAGPAPPVLG
ncbi:MAG: cytochrome P450 [Myxococcales bacterium]|nr:cytochrome P450 [Myxococcales bacterium]